MVVHDASKQEECGLGSSPEMAVKIVDTTRRIVIWVWSTTTFAGASIVGRLKSLTGQNRYLGTAPNSNDERRDNEILTGLALRAFKYYDIIFEIFFS